MRLLGWLAILCLAQLAWSYDGQDDEAMMAEKFELEKELEEAHDPDHVYSDENEKVEEETVVLDEIEAGDEPKEAIEDSAEAEEGDMEDFDMPDLPPWFFLPPWMLPQFDKMFPFLPRHQPDLPPMPPTPDNEKYLRRIDDDDLPPLLPPLPPPRRRRPPPRGYLPPPPPPSAAEDSGDLFDFDYPMPEFPPMMDFFPPPPPYPAPSRDTEEEDGPVKSRARREALIDTLEVHDPNEWWTDVDGGKKNKVTQKLARTKTGIASQQMMLEALDRYSPALHLGTIDTGYLKNPELEQASDRAFGWNPDFYLGDMDAFKYTPQGERVSNLWEFMDMLKTGKMALGRRYKLHKVFFDNCFQCYMNKQLKDVPDITHYQEDYGGEGLVDPFNNEVRDLYWNKVTCSHLIPGKYIIIAIKKDMSHGAWEGGSKGNVESFVMFFNDLWGRQIAVVNPNMYGMQALSPFKRKTAVRGLTYDDGEYGSTSTYSAHQAGVDTLYNSQYTRTGGRTGHDYLPSYHLNKNMRPYYDESRAWMWNSFNTLRKGQQKWAGFRQKNTNAEAIGRPYMPKNDY